ncbi:penicillin-binding protein [Streptomyces sp. MUSC 125]|uniref:penicillin-binding transpeptidase domain-containing protein n=1 Tax=unclassified Streptomyces TaxID=2593676 RepID=UPI00057F99B5|nr:MULTISPECIES: penicillin-binding transpeptidase domain-containing protein [unclassified Streptomyces]KIE26748.1 penicillin-binding protein [Streptomyces sp. MUSC 125]MCH0559233.1 penicillin-binding protein [Streptomyces sp. MUM 16J]
MNRAVKIGIAGTGTALLVLGGIGTYNLVHGLTSGETDSVRTSADRTFDSTKLSTTPPSDTEAVKLTKAFLDSWSAQHLNSAAGDTDTPAEAVQSLQGYEKGLHLKKLAFGHVRAAGTSTVTADATKVTFDVTAQVAGGTWSYPSAVAVRKSTNGRSAVHWNNSVLYPGLGEDQSLTAGQLPVGASTAKVVASDGKTDLASFPSLRDIAATIRKHAEPTGGKAGTGVAVIDDDGTGVKTLKTFTKGRAPVIKTTIDASLQAVAETAVKDHHLQEKPAGTVALDWRNGHILAIAHTGADGDIAINGIKSPGSTMKIITSAALFDQAGLTANSPAPCTESVMANSQLFHNETGMRPNPRSTIAQAFAVSCNTSFIKDGFHYLVHNGDASALHNEAVNVFGMGSWSVGGGVATTDPSIPADTQGGDQAAQFIGQGRVTATPLFMASVAATVRNAGFRQPIILPGQHQDAAPRPMSARTAGYLQSMMRGVATGGTAAPRLNDLPGVGAKTGTAEESDHTNGWLTAYNSRIAVAALVEGGTSGVDSAGYVVRRLLTSS